MSAPEPVARAHAVLSASSAHRWLRCTPSARLEETFPDTTSEFAEEGTFAHRVCETQLKHWLGVMPDTEYNALCYELRADPRFTPDFMEHCKTYVEHCQHRIEVARGLTPDAVILVEERLDFSHVVPEGFGTGDLVIIADRVLDVTDLKFGKGIPVSATWNEQEMLYGLGAVEKYSFLYDLHTVRLTIVQPRISEEPSTWEISVADLILWGESYVKRSAALAWEGKGEFVPGDHCQFCKAKATCRARAEYNLALVAHEFAKPALLDDNEIADILAQADQLKAWVGAVQSFAMAKALAGHKFNGWKLVAGRSNRKYTNQEAVAKKLIDFGIPEAVIYERSLLGITALEAAITKKRFKELLADLVVKPAGAPTLVASSDPRAEIEASALDGFDNLETGDSEA